MTNLVFESNRYGTEKNGNSLNITKEELETSIGIYFLKGIIKMPNIEDYWSLSIAEKMPQNRFQSIHHTPHFVDNNQVSDDEKLDRIWKLQPWIKKLWANFSWVSCGDNQSINEILVASRAVQFSGCTYQKKKTKAGF